MAGAGLAAFSGGLLGLYARTPGMRREHSPFPSQQGTALAKDVWMAGIGLGLVKGGLDRPEGERLYAYDPLRGGNVEVEICREVFYDPKEERLRG